MATRGVGGIDFNALIHGRRLAEQDWREMQRERRTQEAFDLKHEEALEQRALRLHNREAQAYLAPLLTNFQRMADAGVSPTEAFVRQREAIMDDPAFQQMAPEVQQQIITSLSQSAAVRIENAQQAGQLDDVGRLLTAMGVEERQFAGPVAQAIQSGDLQTQLDALSDELGIELNVTEDGMVEFDGHQVPAIEIIPLILQGRTRLAGTPAAQQIYRQETAEQAEEERRRAELEELNQIMNPQGAPVLGENLTNEEVLMLGQGPLSPNSMGSTPEAQAVQSVLGDAPLTPSTPVQPPVISDSGPTAWQAALAAWRGLQELDGRLNPVRGSYNASKTLMDALLQRTSKDSNERKN